MLIVFLNYSGRSQTEGDVLRHPRTQPTLQSSAAPKTNPKQLALSLKTYTTTNQKPQIQFSGIGLTEGTTST